MEKEMTNYNYCRYMFIFYIAHRCFWIRKAKFNFCFFEKHLCYMIFFSSIIPYMNSLYAKPNLYLYGLWRLAELVRTPAPTIWVISNNLLNFFKPQFSFLQNRDNIIWLIGLFWILNVHNVCNKLPGHS